MQTLEWAASAPEKPLLALLPILEGCSRIPQEYQTPCQPTGLSNVQGQIGGLTIHGEITAALTAKGKLAEILAKYLPKLVLPSVTLTHDWVIFKPISV